MLLDWLAPTGIGRMVGDYVAVVFVPGRAVGIFSLAGPSQGGRFDQAIAAVSVPIVEPPRNTRRPSVTGMQYVGATLRCVRGSWAGTPPIRYDYRWLRSGRAIPGATARHYRARVRDAGTLLACRVTGTNAAGSARATSRPVRVNRG